MTLLTVDLGNSSAKLRLCDPSDARVSLGSWSGPGDFSQACAAGFSSELSGASDKVELSADHSLPAWLKLHAAEAVALCAVSGKAAEEQWLTGLTKLLCDPGTESAAGTAFTRARIAGVPETGLLNQTETPTTTGADRLFAARAALQLYGSSIVIDAGTALTVDWVRALPAKTGSGAQATAQGEFMGGAIAAGPELLRKALGRGAVQLFEVDAQAGDPVLGRSSEAALRSGLLHGFRGAAAELIAGLLVEASDPDLPLVLTGGARAWLTDPDPVGALSFHEEPDLVHLGLAFAWSAAQRAATGS